MPNLLYDALFAPWPAREGRSDDLGRWARDRRGCLSGGWWLAAGRCLGGVGVVKGDRIAVQVAKTPEALALYGAAVALGAIFLPLNTAYTAAEVGYFLAMPRRASLSAMGPRQHLPRWPRRMARGW
jgi:malonyl-CoA/methylmalonyl-CoA synthetase